VDVVACAVGIPLAVMGRHHAVQPLGGPTTTTVPATKHDSVQLGIDVWWKNHPKVSFAKEQVEATSIVNYAATDLHANMIAVSFPIYTSSFTSVNVVPGPGTPSTNEIKMLTDTARAAKLGVEFRPLLQVGYAKYMWRGLIHPSDVTTFFDNYAIALKPYMLLAQQLKVSEVIYASEFLSISQSSNYSADWAHLVSVLSTEYHGPLAYAESGAQFLAGSSIVPDLATHGEHTDAYFGAPGETPTAPASKLYDSWASKFDAMSASRTSKTILQEVGFYAGPTGYEEPQTVVGGPTNPKYLFMQKVWFSMVCQIVQNFHLAGVYFWNLDFNIDPNTTASDATDLGPTDWVNRPGAQAIAACFSSFASTS
jgi:hypothetical protein